MVSRGVFSFTEQGEFMKAVMSRAGLIAAPVLAMAIVAPAANAATIHHAAQSASVATVPAQTMPMQSTPMLPVPAQTTPMVPAPGQPTDIVSAAADTAGAAFGWLGVALSKIPLIGPAFTSLGQAVTSMFDNVPIIGDAAKSAVHVFNDNGR
jgi:hypothetical protein